MQSRLNPPPSGTGAAEPVARDTDRMPRDIRDGFINRQEANIDALVRQAYLEGFMRGGDSRKAYDEARAATADASPKGDGK